MDYTTQSQILNELKSLSGKMVAIQNELSSLSLRLSDHISSCHHRHSQCTSKDNQRNEEATRPIEHSDHETVNTQAQTYKNRSVEKSASSNLAMPLEESHANSTFAQRSRAQDQIDDLTENRGEDSPILRRKSSKESKRECLRKSLQQNIVLLVDNLTYSGNEIIDNLIQSECLTETESSDLIGSRKDCVRNLIRTVRGRSYNVMKTFVKCVEKLHPEVAESITQVYEKLMKDRINYIKKCAFCDLKKSDCIKIVADHLWSIDAISEELYDEIVAGKKSTEDLWEKFADEVNRGNNQHKAMKKLREALADRGHYHELALKLRKVSFLKCTCFNGNSSLKPEGHLTFNIVVTDIDEMSSVSPTSTPTSSLGLVDENEVSFAADDNVPANKHENYFLSPRTAGREKRDSCIGLRKNLTLGQNTLAVEFRKVRSNSFGKTSNLRGRTPALSKRRASMFV